MIVTYRIQIRGTIDIPTNIPNFEQSLREAFEYPYTNSEEINFQQQLIDDINGKFGDMVDWQLNKCQEIKTKVRNTLQNLRIEDGKLYINDLFEMEFTDEFDNGDVISWIMQEGFGDIVPCHVIMRSKMLQRNEPYEVHEPMTIFLKKFISGNLFVSAKKKENQFDDSYMCPTPDEFYIGMKCEIFNETQNKWIEHIIDETTINEMYLYPRIKKETI